MQEQLLARLGERLGEAAPLRLRFRVSESLIIRSIYPGFAGIL